MAPTGTTRARARPRRGSATHRSPGLPPGRRRGRRSRRRTCRCRGPRRRGRDSIRVRLTSRSANSARQRTSQPARSSVGSQNISAVFQRAADRRIRRLAGDPHEARLRARAGPRRRRRAPRSRRARPPRGCRARPTARRRSRSATIRTASAVEAASTTAAFGSRVRRNVAHWPLACGCEATAAIRSSSIGSRAIRQWWIGSTSSPAICTSSVSNASVSSVALTAPSSEFSIGTSARSTRPSWTAITASWTDGSGTGS